MTTAPQSAVAQANAELGPKADSLALINRSMEILKAPPSPRQLDVLRLIEAGRKRDGHPPTIREIGDLMGCTSTNTIACHLAALKRKGFVSWSKGKTRTLAVTKHGLRWVS